jgi:hypothetical protein
MQLNDSYKREDLLKFLENDFLEDFKCDIRPVNTNELTNIKKASTLGRSKNLDLQVFEFCLNGSLNKRMSLTKDAFSIMKSTATFSALAVFYSTEIEDWRLSLMTINPEKTEKGKAVMSYSDPRRYSYLLGKNAKVNTPTKYLISKGKTIDFNDLKSRFSLEVVNKEFYREISELFIKLVGGTIGKGKNKIIHPSLLKLPYVGDKDKVSLEFSVRLIGRIVFCWFLREKYSEAKKSLMPKELLSLQAVNDNSDYYHKILEPIFFSILNEPAKSRKKIYTKESFSQIPYLNGGLFSPQEDDYFSYNDGKQAINHNVVIVPDNWLKELFSVLETYNFTIDENISFDEELSIDPEMLGRIFENLLAEINPETGESARKSTGSYYTPRAIVDYMVDESIYSYLQTKTGITEKKLRSVITYDFNDDFIETLLEDEKNKIIDALEKVKILDPACGSGAFPIGMLKKIVFILQQIDTDGEVWFKKQIEGASPEIKRVIEREFANKNFDYIRKLGIIRENIYGIDIQPIATEMSRLRCFLTLIVDQGIHDNLENRGIEPLPNLDFKFVTANSLISLPQASNKDQMGLFEDKSGIKELKELRDMFFNASGTEREQLKLRFVQAQKKMFDRLIKMSRGGGLASLTTSLTTWDPFGHSASNWFDPEWMLGVKNGFDIVIANPPYLKERNNKEIFDSVNNSSFGKQYHQGKMDFWYYFLHKAIDIVKTDGIISYITSRYWLNSVGARKLIQRIASELSFISFIDIGKLKVFDAVAGQHMIAVYKKTKMIEEFIYKKLENDISDINKNYNTDNVVIRRLSNEKVFSSNNEIILDNCYQNLSDIVLLGKITEISQGVVQNPDKVSKKMAQKYKLFQGEGVFVLEEGEYKKLQPLLEKEKFFVRNFYDEKDIGEYLFIKNRKKYLLYLTKANCLDIENFPNLKEHLKKYKRIMQDRRETKNGTVLWFQLHWPRKEKYFEGEKIVIPSMFNKPNATLISEQSYFGLSSNLIIPLDKSYDLRYLLSILNSKFALDWFYKNGKKRGVGVDIGVEKLRSFPIKIADEKKQKLFLTLIDKVLSLTKTDDYLDDFKKQAKVKEYEYQIDKMVYKLYGLAPE